MFLVSICAMDPSEGAGSVQKQLEAKRWEKSSVIFSFVGCNQARSPQIYSNLRWLCKKKHIDASAGKPNFEMSNFFL